jgi:hypothetical protein
MAATDLTENPDFGNLQPHSAITRFVSNVQAPCGLLKVTGVGAAAYQDNSGTIYIPSSHITNYAKRIADTRGRGTSVGFCLRYDETYDGEVVQSPVIEVFGRLNSSDPWRRLLTKDTNPSITSTLTVNPLEAASGDVSDGTYKYTTIDPCSNVFDLMSCSEFIVAIRTEVQYNVGDDDGDVDLSTVMAVLIN